MDEPEIVEENFDIRNHQHTTIPVVLTKMDLRIGDKFRISSIEAAEELVGDEVSFSDRVYTVDNIDYLNGVDFSSDEHDVNVHILKLFEVWKQGNIEPV